MALWKPDPTFLSVAADGGRKSAREARLCRGVQSRSVKRQARLDVRDRYRSAIGELQPAWWAGWRCRGSATRSIISGGMRAARRCARTRRIRMSSAATCWRRGCDRRGCTSSTPSPTRATPTLVKVIEAEEIAATRWLQPAAYDSLRTRRDLRERARRCRRRRAGRNLPARSRELRGARAGGKSIAVRNISATISGGTSATTSRSPANGARPT